MELLIAHLAFFCRFDITRCQNSDHNNTVALMWLTAQSCSVLS